MVRYNINVMVELLVLCLYAIQYRKLIKNGQFREICKIGYTRQSQPSKNTTQYVLDTMRKQKKQRKQVMDNTYQHPMVR